MTNFLFHKRLLTIVALVLIAVVLVSIIIFMTNGFLPEWKSFGNKVNTFKADDTITVSATAVHGPSGSHQPQRAWVISTESHVRAWPDENYPPVAAIVRGQEVRVIEKSPDGRWAHIDQPVEGWVPVDQLRLADKGNAPRLTPTVFRIYRWVKAKPRLRVRSAPNTDSEIVTHVMHGELVEIDQLTDDRQWVHIIAPAEGWVSTRYLSLTPVKTKEN